MKTLLIITLSLLALASCQINRLSSKLTTAKPFRFNFNLPNSNTVRPVANKYNTPRYNANNEGRYRSNEGRYNSNSDGSYRGDNSGRYQDNSGQYVPDTAGQYKHVDNKYAHLGVGGGQYAHQGGDFEKYKGSKDHSPGDKYVGDSDKYKGYKDVSPGDKYVGDSDKYKGYQDNNPYKGSGDNDKYKGGKDKFPADSYKGEKNTGITGNVPSDAGRRAGGSGPVDICKYSPTNIKIIKQDGELEKQKYYYSFETENCMYKEEQSVVNQKQEGEVRGAKGLYYYVGPDGVKYTVTYSSDEHGFVPQGDHIPTIPPLIAKGLAYLKSIGKA